MDLSAFRFNDPTPLQAQFNRISDGLGMGMAYSWAITRHYGAIGLKEAMQAHGYPADLVARLVNSVSGQGRYEDIPYHRDVLAGYKAEAWLNGQAVPIPPQSDGTVQPPVVPPVVTPPTGNGTLSEYAAQLEAIAAGLRRL